MRKLFGITITTIDSGLIRQKKAGMNYGRKKAAGVTSGTLCFYPLNVFRKNIIWTASKKSSDKEVNNGKIFSIPNRENKKVGHKVKRQNKVPNSSPQIKP